MIIEYIKYKIKRWQVPSNEKSYHINSVGNILEQREKVFIPWDPENGDYQEFLKWLNKGNVPTFS